MPFSISFHHVAPRHLIIAWIIASLGLATPLRAADFVAGNVTTSLGPTFFVDDAANGGTDTDINQPAVTALNRNFNGLLTRNQGPTRINLTGFGFATHTSSTANDADTVVVTFTYLGADELLGGGDDVVVGTASGGFTFVLAASNPNAEYYLAFDAPLSADLIITGTRFRIQVAPANAAGAGSLKLKSGTLAYETSSGAKLSVAGFTSPLIVPQRVNLAKFQPVTTTSTAGQRLAAYLTDGVTGNDNRWQGNSSAWQSAVINFPYPVEVGSAQLFTGVDDSLPIASYSVQSWNGSAWVAIAGAGVSGNTNVERNLVFTNPVTASSFRFLSPEANLRVRELALYPPNGPGGYPLGTDLTLNLAYQRPAVATSHTTGNFPLSTVDGRTHSGSSWQTTSAGLNTLEIEMVATTKIGSIHLYSGGNGASPLADFTLKFWNGTTWLDIPGGAVTGNAAADRIITFTTPVTTTRVLLEFTKSDTTPSVVRELQIFPANTGNVGYALGTNINPSGRYAAYEEFNDAFYQITNPASNRDVAVATGGQPALEQPGVTTAQAQYQVLLNLSNGTYRLRNRDTGNCLSGAQLSKTPGAALTDAPYLALPDQDWILEATGAGLYQIINAWSGLAIDTQGGATSQGTALVQNTASTATTQRWKFNYDIRAPKKGNGGSNFASALNSKWLYNWGQNNSVTVPADTIYHPMQWGSFNWIYGTTPGPIWQYYPAWRKRGDGIHLMGFNEPDRTDQSNISLETSVALWPRLMALDQPLVSPSPGTLNPPVGEPSWHKLFYDEADRLGYRVEYNAIHTYPGPSGGSSNNLINLVQSEFDEFKRPVWLTEFSFVDWGGTQSWSEEDNYQTLAEFLWRAEELAALRKYALFVFTADANYPQPANAWTSVTPAPRSNTYDSDGNITAFGKLYAAWDSDTTIRTDKTYVLHHKASRKRIANLTTQSNLSGRNIRIDGTLVNWTLVSAGVSNRYYAVSSLDGRRISRQNANGTANANGAAVALVAAGTTGAAVEWTLVPSQNGWYFLENPDASATTVKRLKLVYSNATFVATYSMVAASNSGDDVQWRFIVPIGGNAPPVLASIPAQTVNEGSTLTFTASATDDNLPINNLRYTLIDPPSGATIASTTGDFSWTPNETRGPGIYSFKVRVSDGFMAHEQLVTITVTEVNVAPVLASIPAQTVNEGNTLTFTASATDADLPANTLTYSLLNAPSGASITADTGIFTWTPAAPQAPGIFNFTVRVSDGNLTSDQPVAVTVQSPLPSSQVDSDNDGLSDLLEYAFLTDPGTPNANPFRVIGTNLSTITLAFPWNWQATELTWQLRHGQDLSNIAAWPVVAPGASTSTREGNIDRITVAPAMAHPDRGFYVLEVIGN